MKSGETTDIGSFKMYTNGKWVKSVGERIFEHRNPARLSQATGLFPLSTPEDANRAITAAQDNIHKVSLGRFTEIKVFFLAFLIETKSAYL
jgi:acyl-CoA reductase-like NAD-dependent aldehyde dehydrogenase